MDREAIIASIKATIAEIQAKIAQYLQANPQPMPTTTSPRFTDLADGVKTYEGYYPGSRSYKNCNPGNVRYSRIGYADFYGPVREDRSNVADNKRGFAMFKDYATGFLYLTNLIKDKARRHPEWTLLQFIGDELDGWAPASDNNVPKAYALYLSKRLKVDLETFRLKNLT